MLTICVTLTVLSVVATAIGVTWMLKTRGRTWRRSGEDVGREMVADLMDDVDDTPSTHAQWTAFKGKAVATGAEASISYGEIKAMLAAKAWDRALPLLLTIAGVFGLLIFGALALTVGLEEKVIGLLLLAMALYALIRTVIGIARA